MDLSPSKMSMLESYKSTLNGKVMLNNRIT